MVGVPHCVSTHTMCMRRPSIYRAEVNSYSVHEASFNVQSKRHFVSCFFKGCDLIQICYENIPVLHSKSFISTTIITPQAQNSPLHYPTFKLTTNTIVSDNSQSKFSFVCIEFLIKYSRPLLNTQCRDKVGPAFVYFGKETFMNI